MRWLFVGMLAWFSVPLIVASATAQDSTSRKYSPEVVAKAEKILKAAGLRRSGKSIQSGGIPEIARALTALKREKRELRLVHEQWREVENRLATLRQELDRLNVQYGELNLQLARVAGVDVAANNRIVGLLNATTAKTKSLMAQREPLNAELKNKRKTLDDAETKYAETVLAIRHDYDAERDRIAKTLMDEEMRIALQVMHANFATPKMPTADAILSAIDHRIGRVEQEIFHETIDMVPQNGSLYVDVVVGKKSTAMVVDSGATMVTLPMKTATELGIEVPLEARELKLVLADGRTIPARAVTLEKVRVGKFEAENVEAAVLDAVATNARPLLGMSFLSHFKVEIDRAGKTLRMLRVDHD